MPSYSQSEGIKLLWGIKNTEKKKNIFCYFYEQYLKTYQWENLKLKKTKPGS